MNTARITAKLDARKPVDEVKSPSCEDEDFEEIPIFAMDEDFSDIDDVPATEFDLSEYEAALQHVRAADGKNYKLVTIYGDNITYQIVEACDTDIRIVAWNIDELTLLNPNKCHERITDIINEQLTISFPDEFKEKEAKKTKHIFMKQLWPVDHVMVKTANLVDMDDTIIKSDPSYEQQKPIYIEQKELTTVLEKGKTTGVNICCTARSHLEVMQDSTSPLMTCNMLEPYKGLFHTVCFVDQVGVKSADDLTLKYSAMIYFAAKYQLPRSSVGLMDNSGTEISACREKQFRHFHVDVDRRGELRADKHYAANLKWLESHNVVAEAGVKAAVAGVRM